MYLLVHENGSKYWRLDYRRPISQKRNTLALGILENVSLKEARLKRDEAKRMLANGIDPAEERKQKNAQRALLENTFNKYAEEWLKIICSSIYSSVNGISVTSKFITII